MSLMNHEKPMDKPLTVLIVSYLFPPLAGGGIPRVQKLVKYFNRLGVHTIVLTVDPPPGMVEDPALLNDIPSHTPIYRVPMPRWFHIVLSLWRRPSRRAHGSNQAQDNAEQPSQPKNNTWLRQRRYHLKQSLRAWAKRFIDWWRVRLLIPDDEVVWVKHAVQVGKQALERYPVDLIFSSSGPVSNHLVARALKRQTKLPWVADFRDPWTENMHRTTIRWRLWLEKRMEKSVFLEADAITTVTQSFAHDFKRLYPERDVQVIYNGFDPEDFTALKGSPPAAPLTLAYTGILYGKRHPRYFFQAIRRLIDDGTIDENTLRLEVAGILDYPGHHENHDAIVSLGLEKVVIHHGFLPHHQALALLKRSHVLVIFGDQDQTAGRYIPGKLFEYMAIGRPILGLLKSGEASALIQRLGLGFHADPESVEAIEQALRDIVTRFRKGELLSSEWTTSERMEPPADKARHEALLPFRRDEQAKMFYRLFQSLVNTDKQ